MANLTTTPIIPIEWDRVHGVHLSLGLLAGLVLILLVSVIYFIYITETRYQDTKSSLDLIVFSFVQARRGNEVTTENSTQLLDVSSRGGSPGPHESVQGERIETPCLCQASYSGK